jgi:L-ribulokinase
MAGVRAERYRPDPARGRVYARLYRLYRRLHDAFGTKAGGGSLADVMKELLVIRDAARS